MNGAAKFEIDWARQKLDFEPDGCLRDIYIENASLEDWETLMTLIVETDPHAWLSRDGERISLATAPLKSRFSREVTYHLHFTIVRVALVCYFFTQSEIELDLMPGQIGGEQELRGVLLFMARLGERTGKPVILTPENIRERPIFRFDPADGGGRWSPP